MLPTEYRLKQDKDFDRLFGKGKGVFDPICGVKMRPNGLGVTRFAVVVGTKVSKSAVVRNKLRRQVREIVRLKLADVLPGFDVALLVRPEAKSKKFSEIETHVLDSLTKAKLLRRV